MRKLLIATFLLSSIMIAKPAVASAGSYIEYYRDNLFLGLAYHRVGCATDWNTIKNTQEFDGFTTYDYCRVNTSSNSVPSGEWYDWNYAYSDYGASGQSDGAFTCNNHTNNVYDTPNNAARSNSCSYNILTDCNSDCWIEEFSTCQGYTVETASPCW